MNADKRSFPGDTGWTRPSPRSGAASVLVRAPRESAFTTLFSTAPSRVFQWRPANRGGLKLPYSSVTFYAGGEALIRALTSRQPDLLNDPEALYRRIAER